MKKDTDVLNLLKTSKGQIDAIIRMYEDDRYCIDVSKQILAAQAILKKANMKLLNNHIKSCVKEAFVSGEGDAQVDEIMEIIDKYAK